MMACRQQGLGVGTECSVLLKFLHPKPVINKVYINLQPNVKVDDLLAMQMEHKKVSCMDREVVVFQCKQFSSKIYTVKKWVKVIIPSSENTYFVQIDKSAIDEKEELTEIPCSGHDIKDNIHTI